MNSESTLNFPFDFRPLHPEETKELKKNFGVSFEFTRVGPKGFVISDAYKEDAEKIYNMQIRSDDVFVRSYPRSGTTWTQELVWLIVKDLDYEAARATPLTHRYGFIEYPSICTAKAVDNIIERNKSKGIQADLDFLRRLIKPSSEILSNRPSPRFMKTHLPLSCLPPTALDTAKMVYVARDPRDAAVSFYNLSKTATYLNFKGDFKTYWNLFINDLVLFTPYFEHLKESWALRHHPNMLFLFYEELSKDLPAAIRRVADFFGKQLSEEQIAGLCNHLKFDNLKKNDSVNLSELNGCGIMETDGTYIRKGKAGGWREYFDADMARQAQRWMDQHLRDTDLRFPHLS